jgi:hypothetical protein
MWLAGITLVLADRAINTICLSNRKILACSATQCNGDHASLWDKGLCLHCWWYFKALTSIRLFNKRHNVC